MLIVEENHKFTFTNVDADILRLYMVSKKYPHCSEGCKYALNTTHTQVEPKRLERISDW